MWAMQMTPNKPFNLAHRLRSGLTAALGILKTSRMFRVTTPTSMVARKVETQARDWRCAVCLSGSS
jgi:hypothetical protein